MYAYIYRREWLTPKWGCHREFSHITFASESVIVIAGVAKRRPTIRIRNYELYTNNLMFNVMKIIKNFTMSIVNYQLSILLILAVFLSPLTMRANTAAQLANQINKFSVDYGAATRFRATASGDTVTVTGLLTEGTRVPISATAAPSEKEFDKWTGDVSGVAGVEAASTTYTMGNSDAIVTATYKDVKTAIQPVETSLITRKIMN